MMKSPASNPRSNDQFPVFSPVKSICTHRRIFQPVDDVKPLMETTTSNLRRHQSACLRVAAVIIEYEEVSHVILFTARTPQIANP